MSSLQAPRCSIIDRYVDRIILDVYFFIDSSVGIDWEADERANAIEGSARGHHWHVIRITPDFDRIVAGSCWGDYERAGGLG